MPGFTWGVSAWIATFFIVKSWRLVSNNPKPHPKGVIGEVHPHSHGF